MRVDGAVATPGRALRGLVTCQGYDIRGAPPARHRGLPSPYLTLIVTFDDVALRILDDAGGRRIRPTVLGGLHETPIVIEHDGDQAGLHISVHPLAARRVLGLPAGAIAGLDLGAEEVLGATGHELHERVAAATDWAGRFAAVERVLGERLSEPVREPRPEIGHAFAAMLAGARVGAVADEVGWSERHLTTSVRAEIGTTPKVLGRMARFDRARRRILARVRDGAPLGLADVAATGGFADQAHLTREFRAFTGTSPTRWLAEEQWAPPP